MVFLTLGIYPYSYMDSFKSFEDNQLPPENSFYNIHEEHNITDAQYLHAQSFFKQFNRF